MEKKRAFDLRCLAKKQIHHKPPRDRPAGGGGGGGYQQMFMRGGSAPRSNPLPFYTPLFTKTSAKQVPLLHTVY